MGTSKQNKYGNPVKALVTGILDLFREEKPAGRLEPYNRLEGKTVLIDGASSGLGYATAVGLARLGAKVIMACRSRIPEKGESVKRETGSEDIYMIRVDLLFIMKRANQNLPWPPT